MKTANDTKTRDICEMDLAGEVPPPVDKAKERAARFREKHGAAMTVFIPGELLAEFNEHCAARGKTKAQVIAHLLKTQLLRKR